MPGAVRLILLLVGSMVPSVTAVVLTGLGALWAGIVVALFGPTDLSRRSRSQVDDRALSDAPESGAAAVKFVR